MVYWGGTGGDDCRRHCHAQFAAENPTLPLTGWGEVFQRSSFTDLVGQDRAMVSIALHHSSEGLPSHSQQTAVSAPALGSICRQSLHHHLGGGGIVQERREQDGTSLRSTCVPDVESLAAVVPIISVVANYPRSSFQKRQSRASKHSASVQQCDLSQRALT